MDGAAQQGERKDDTGPEESGPASAWAAVTPSAVEALVNLPPLLPSTADSVEDMLESANRELMQLYKQRDCLLLAAQEREERLRLLERRKEASLQPAKTGSELAKRWSRLHEESRALTEARDSYAARCDALGEQLEAKAQETAHLGAELASLGGAEKLATLMQQICDTEKRLGDALIESASAAAALDAEQLAHATTAERCRRIESELNAARSETDELKEKMQRAAEADALAAKLHAAALSALQGKLDQARLDARRIRSDRDAVRTAALDVEARASAAIAEAGSGKELLKTAARVAEAARTDAAASRKRLAVLESAHKKQGEDVVALRNELAGLQTAASAAQAEARRQRDIAARAAAESPAEADRAKAKQLQAQLADAQALVARMETDLNRLQAAAAAATQARADAAIKSMALTKEAAAKDAAVAAAKEQEMTFLRRAKLAEERLQRETARAQRAEAAVVEFRACAESAVAARDAAFKARDVAIAESAARELKDRAALRDELATAQAAVLALSEALEAQQLPETKLRDGPSSHEGHLHDGGATMPPPATITTQVIPRSNVAEIAPAESPRGSDGPDRSSCSDGRPLEQHRMLRPKPQLPVVAVKLVKTARVPLFPLPPAKEESATLTQVLLCG
jgi:hypothetical protein